MANNGGIMNGLKQLFQSPQQKEQQKLNRQRRINYLKKKYGSHKEEE
jgi:hypothetical protein